MQPPPAEAQSGLEEALLGNARGDGTGGGGVGGGTGTDTCHAPPCGSGDGGGVSDSYLALIQKHLRENLRYPYTARRMGAQGTVVLRFELGTDGRAREVTVVRQCPFRVLTQAAIESLKSAEPLPIPAGFSATAFSIEVPITFVLE
ncbi:MAG: energy transducer TonB [Bdellovibrionota bacterium]